MLKKITFFAKFYQNTLLSGGMYGMFLGIHSGSFHRHKASFVFRSWGGLKGGKLLPPKHYAMPENAYVESGIETHSQCMDNQMPIELLCLK